jgi:hypothetical protein
MKSENRGAGTMNIVPIDIKTTPDQLFEAVTTHSAGFTFTQTGLPFPYEDSGSVASRAQHPL